MKKLLLLSMASLFAVFIFNACEGPEGPQGPAGVDGNANVKAYTFTVYQNEWVGADGDYYAEIDMPELTDDIYNYGDVRVYVQATNAADYQALPYTWFDYSVMRYWYKPEVLAIQNIFDNVDNEVSHNYKFKVVLIEGVVPDKSVNFDNYEVVKAHYKLNEIELR